MSTLQPIGDPLSLRFCRHCRSLWGGTTHACGPSSPNLYGQVYRGKPRLRLGLGPWPGGRMWVCSGGGYHAIGPSPRDAYMAWRNKVDRAERWSLQVQT